MKLTGSAFSEDALREIQLASETVFDGKLLKVHRDRVRLPDQTEGIREYICHPGAVVIVAVLPEGDLLFERQFRYPLHQVFIELPAGKIDTGEPVLECARRELREETGYEAQSWRHIGTMHPCIGYSDERIEIFLAHELSYVGDAHDEGEFLELFTMSVSEAVEAIHCGKITDGKTITALFRAFPFLSE